MTNDPNNQASTEPAESSPGGASAPTGLPTSADGGLQFDQADFGAAATASALACKQCQQPILEQYFDINGSVLCPACSQQVADTLTGGSGVARFFAALFAGAAAGAVGAGIYYGVAKVTGYEIGLVAIVVGLLVGGSVRWGCRGRGGWLYQLMAVLLAYMAIGGSNTIFVYEVVRNDMRSAGESPPVTASAPAASRSGEHAASPPSAIEPDASQRRSEQPLAFGTVGTVLLVLVLILVSPVAVAIQSPITILIAGFALYEAWRINRRTRLSVTGPFMVGGTAGPLGGLPPAGPQDHANG